MLNFSLSNNNLFFSTRIISFRIPLKTAIYFLFLLFILLTSIWFSLTLGSVFLSFNDVYDSLFGETSTGNNLLVNYIRLPRVLTGALSGICLGLSGCLIQALAKNKLASPDTLGINEGAALFVSLNLLLSVDSFLGSWWLATFGAVVSVFFLFLISVGIGKNGNKIIVIGIGFGGFINSIVEFIMSFQNLTHSSAIYAWSIGNLGGGDVSELKIAGFFVIILIFIILLLNSKLNFLYFDNSIPISLGVNIKYTQIVVIIISSLLAGISVGISGPIGFVALAGPIIVQKIVGNGKLNLFSSSLAGAILIIASDTIGRAIFSDIQIPVGIITNMLGGPFLLWTLLKN